MQARTSQHNLGQPLDLVQYRGVYMAQEQAEQKKHHDLRVQLKAEYLAALVALRAARSRLPDLLFR